MAELSNLTEVLQGFQAAAQVVSEVKTAVSDLNPFAKKEEGTKTNTNNVTPQDIYNKLVALAGDSIGLDKNKLMAQLGVKQETQENLGILSKMLNIAIGSTGPVQKEYFKLFPDGLADNFRKTLDNISSATQYDLNDLGGFLDRKLGLVPMASSSVAITVPSQSATVSENDSGEYYGNMTLVSELTGVFDQHKKEFSKPGAKLDNLNPRVKAMFIFLNRKFPGLVITSGNDSKHAPRSHHYDDNAMDIGGTSSDPVAYKKLCDYLKTNEGIQELKQNFGDIKEILGPRNDENHKTHVHIGGCHKG